MNKTIAILILVCVIPMVCAAGDRWDLIFSDGTTTLNGTDVCLDDGTCLSNSAAGVTDTNETTRFNTLVGTDCGAGNYSYGFDSNGLIKCREDTTGAGSDTNASTACSTTEVLLGNGTCLDSDNFYDDTDTTYTNGTGLSLVGDTFSVVLSYFQGLFIGLTDSFGGEVSGTYDNIVLDNDALDDQYVELTDLPLVNLTTPYCGNITGATSDLCTITDGNSSWNESGHIASTQHIGSLSCSNKQVAKYNSTSSLWECKDISPDAIVTVAKSGGDYTTIQSAIDSISDASATKIYIVLIYPGVYEETLIGKDYVVLSGVGYREEVLIKSATGPIYTYPDHGGCLRGLSFKLEPTIVNQVLLYAPSTKADWCNMNDVLLTVESSTNGVYSRVLDIDGGTLNLLKCHISYVMTGTNATESTHHIFDINGVASSNLYISSANVNIADENDELLFFDDNSNSGSGISVNAVDINVNLSSSSYSGSSIIVKSRGTDAGKHIWGANIKLTSEGGGTGTWVKTNSDAGGVIIYSEHNHIEVSGFDNNYWADTASGDTVFSDFDNIIAEDGYKGVGDAHYVSSLDNGNFNVSGGITASHFTGNGSQLTGITMTESDPYWTANKSSYSTTTEILALSYYNNISNFTGTLTDDKICVYDSSQNIINCTYTDQTGAGGNVKSGDGTYTYNDTDTIYFNSTYAGINLEVNGSDNWDDYNTANSTWFQNIAGALSLKLSQLTIWADTWLGTKDTDDLSEGSINLYDNSSWNESLADTLYADISVTDTNETTRFNTLVGTDCGAGNYSYGFDSNGLIKCREDTGNTYTHLTNFTDDLGDRGYTHLTNFTDDILWTTDFNSTFDSRDSDTVFDSTNVAWINESNTFTENQIMENNLTIDMIVFEDDATHNIESNSTCVIIQGDTSKMYIC